MQLELWCVECVHSKGEHFSLNILYVCSFVVNWRKFNAQFMYKFACMNCPNPIRNLTFLELSFLRLLKMNQAFLVWWYFRQTNVSRPSLFLCRIPLSLSSPSPPSSSLLLCINRTPMKVFLLDVLDKYFSVNEILEKFPSPNGILWFEQLITKLNLKCEVHIHRWRLNDIFETMNNVN